METPAKETAKEPVEMDVKQPASVLQTTEVLTPHLTSNPVFHSKQQLVAVIALEAARTVAVQDAETIAKEFAETIVVANAKLTAPMIVHQHAKGIVHIVAGVNVHLIVPEVADLHAKVIAHGNAAVNALTIAKVPV